MTTYRIGYPSDVKRKLEQLLPRLGSSTLTVKVTPRDRAERKCPVWDADHYEVHAYYTTTSPDVLDQLEKAISELPGVYLTTQVRGSSGSNIIIYSDRKSVV